MKTPSRFEASLLWVFLGVVFLYSTAIVVTLSAPRFIDPSWKTPTSYYQVQMYEVSDPNLYISSESAGIKKLEYVHHLKSGETLLAFQETESVKIVAPKELEEYVTAVEAKPLVLTSKLLLLRKPEKKESFDAVAAAEQKRTQLKGDIEHTFLELYDPGVDSAFSLSRTEGLVEDFVDEDFKILETSSNPPSWHRDPGVIFVKNPEEYRIREYGVGKSKTWKYDPRGRAVASVEELTDKALGFRSRKELILRGQEIYAHEGCFYCHTDQTRTLVQDVVANGSEDYPAPPSSANEYIYQKVTFPGTKRNGPDLSRVGVKRPSRDWHKSHFWAPKTASAGSIMPSFRHFFDFDPRGTARSVAGVPNQDFEAIFQYLMTKGTRITPPTQAWWLGKDPVDTLKIIEGKPQVVGAADGR